jgi:hypothetical protein
MANQRRGMTETNRTGILRELYTFWLEKGPGNFALADTLKCFKAGDQIFLTAMNQLLAEGLVVGVSSGVKIEDSTERAAIAANPGRIKDIRKEIRPWYKDPVWIGTILGAAALLATIVGMLLGNSEH